ncbi:hypothetical protein WICPIJ_007911 [Wickerhamomyces pijperi]|uniref:Uncharacterized protein n=1 Tax=Wickerhamomyces pijperi TaxID=599730 RepID=A0A9P8TJH9_WICPI|nr:hypothetical protein WICPIJ_007911 [Wickerhamomyces pijperi]
MAPPLIFSLRNSNFTSVSFSVSSSPSFQHTTGTNGPILLLNLDSSPSWSKKSLKSSSSSSSNSSSSSSPRSSPSPSSSSPSPVNSQSKNSEPGVNWNGFVARDK